MVNILLMLQNDVLRNLFAKIILFVNLGGK